MYRATLEALLGGGGDDRRLRPPVAQLPDRRLPLLHVRRPGRGRPARRLLPALWDAGQRAVLAHGGALSHHHGVGLNRAGSWPRRSARPIEVLVATKAALDPHGILNPGKLGLPSPLGSVVGLVTAPPIGPMP